MAARVAKHAHRWRIISHVADMSRVLVMCADCPETKVWSPSTHRVKVKDRVYRDQSPEEFAEMIAPLGHLCCG